ncbi:hypothetical protein M8J77_009407 [Diaphorina citri]|nr:hypothetical protein M8J77_009407 [Diaphorina citri]
MELCSASENVLVNNNDLKTMQDGEIIDDDAQRKENTSDARKSIGVKRESTTDDDSDINCSIVQDQPSCTQDSSIKITFKLQKKDKSEKKKTKNKNKSKHNSNNSTEKVSKLIIKDTHGAYSIKNMNNEKVHNDVNFAETTSMPEQNEQLSDKAEVSCKDNLALNKHELETEKNAQTDVSHMGDLKLINSDNLETETKLNDSGGSSLSDIKDDIVDNENINTCSNITPKRKSEPDSDNNEPLSKNDQKTENEDCSTEIIPRTKRRKTSAANTERLETEPSPQKSSIESSSDDIDSKLSSVNESATNKRELSTSATEIEPKSKKLRREFCTSSESSEGEEAVENISNNDAVLNNIFKGHKSTDREISTSKLSIEIPEEKKSTSSHSNIAKTKLEEKSPTLKSPRDAKKITLKDFLDELNEESKNIKEGDEIPDDDDEGEMSNDVGCVIVREGEKTQEDDILVKEKSKKIAINSKHNARDSELSSEEVDLDTTLTHSDSRKSKDTNKTVDKNVEDAEDLEKIHSKKEMEEDEKNKKQGTNENEKNSITEGNEKSHKEIDMKNKSTDNEVLIKSETLKSDSGVKVNERKNETQNKADLDKQVSPKSSISKPGDLDNMSSEDSSESSDASNSSDSSSSGSDSSDSDSSSDSETGSDSSDSESSDTEKKKQPVPTVAHPKKLKIRNAPSLSQDSVHKSDSSSSNHEMGEQVSKRLDEDKAPDIKHDITPVETLSQKILAGSTGSKPVVVKKKRGRPRKNPLPEDILTSNACDEPPKPDEVPCKIEIKTEMEDEIVQDNTVVSIVNMDGEVKVPKKRGRKPGFKVTRKAGRGRKRKCGRPRKKYYEEYKKQKELKKREEENELIPLAPPAPVVKRRPGRPKKIRDPEPSTSVVNMNDQYIPSDALSEQLLQLNSQLNMMVNNIPTDDQNSNEITDNRLLEEINSGLDVITEEIVSEDVSNYLGNPLDEILQFQEPKKEIKVENDDDDIDNYDNMNIYDEKPAPKKPGRPPKYAKAQKKLKSDDPNYHKKYYKYVKIPKDQQKKRGPKKRVLDDDAAEKKKRISKTGKRPGRPRKRDLGAIERREEKPDNDSDNAYDESLSKELESVNRSMENILTDCADDKDFTVSHLKFEQLSEDQLKRSNRSKKSDIGMFSDFDNQIDELIEMAASEVQERPKPKYSYYERIPKHLQKKRGRPRKTDNPDAPPRPPKPKKEKPPKPKKTIKVKKMVTDPETGEEVEVEVEEEVEDDDDNDDYIDFDEEDEYDEDIDDEDKDKDFDIEDYLKKGKNGLNSINDNLDYEEVYPTKEKLFKPRKTLKSFKSLKAQHHARFNRFGKFGNKIRSMMPRRNINACDFRYVTVCDADLNPIAKVQRMYCVKIAPASYDIAEKYKPRIKLRNLDEEDVSDFFDKYWCDQCEISFLETKINKRRHEYIYHTEEIECDLCDRTVSNRYNLKKHREIFHQKKVYTCKTCDEEYKKFRTFQMHVWENHPDVRGRDRAYFCNICQTVFYRRASFKFHYHEHLNGNIFAQFDTSLSDIEFLLKQLMF